MIRRPGEMRISGVDPDVSLRRASRALFVRSSSTEILYRTSRETTPTSRKLGIPNHSAFMGTSKGGIRLPLSMVTRSPLSNSWTSGWSRGSSFGILSSFRIFSSTTSADCGAVGCCESVIADLIDVTCAAKASSIQRLEYRFHISDASCVPCAGTKAGICAVAAVNGSTVCQMAEPRYELIDDNWIRIGYQVRSSTAGSARPKLAEEDVQRTLENESWRAANTHEQRCPQELTGRTQT